ncbi:hypothetical protein HNP38_000643 [Chryseobacterium defluvii]|uniref:Lipoprotein n=1 Tax=Chryseobacterium defluvii TaxID=160396 RepID=A0A840K777_9FLAO|nr:hypothetical protein [Chryseobacterium defluvii]MBB4805371.1 hypothetical protein [Chryseobacterium defluvii]
MRKKNTLWLSLGMAFILALQSCRNDYFPEQERYNNSSEFKLTSKRISLDQSKHKAGLLPGLEKAKDKMGFEGKRMGEKMNASGKTVHYSDGVSINTNDVIYIENGPDFYTYTFKIERENAPANAPVENLVLSPLSDGSWREMLITYNLTDQEKQTMNARGSVDLTGKVEYTPLESGTYSSAMKQDLVCYYKTVSYYTSCSENAHHHGEASDEDGGPCKADVQSVLVITVTRVCTMVGGGGTETETTPGVTYPETGGGNPTNPNNGTNPNNPCGGNGIITQPQDPNSTLGTQEGCNTGTPTLPNLVELPKPLNPCTKIKAKFADAKFKAKYQELNTPAMFAMNHEKGYYERLPPVGTTGVEPSFVVENAIPCSHGMDLPQNKNGIVGLIHIHNDEDCNGDIPIKAPSPADVRTFLCRLMKQSKDYTGSYNSAYSVVVTSLGSYMLQYNGEAEIPSNTWDKIGEWRDWYTNEYNKLILENKLTQENTEKVFAQFLKEKVKINGLEVYRVTETSSTKLEYDPITKKIILTLCP